MCQFQVSWNFVYNIRQLKYISLARKFHLQCFGGVMVMRISSPSLASKCAYGTYATVNLLPNYLVNERFMASKSICTLGHLG